LLQYSLVVMLEARTQGLCATSSLLLLSAATSSLLLLLSAVSSLLLLLLAGRSSRISQSSNSSARPADREFLNFVISVFVQIQ
jgi:hypothetical protein